MAKIVSISSGAIDSIAVTKRVFWRPDTESTILKVGQPVCYHSDSIYDHKDRSSDPTHLGLRDDTYAEGAQDKTARLFCVEEPLSANLHAFAGICKSLGPKAGADGDMIEIWKPNGAVLPVWTDQSVTLDQTVLGISNGEADLSVPGQPVAIAKETIDRSADADNGLVWAKVDPNMFIWLHPNTTVDFGTGATDVHRSIVTSAATTGFAHFDVQTTFTGVIASGNFKGGLFYVNISGIPTAAGATYISAVHGQLNISGTLNGAGLIVSGMMAQVHGSGTITSANIVTGMFIDLNLTGTITTANVSVLYLSENCTGTGAGSIDSMIHCHGSGEVAHMFEFIGFGGGNAILQVTGNTAHDATDRCLVVNIDGSTYYIVCQDSRG